jgi:hypothetical protein
MEIFVVWPQAKFPGDSSANRFFYFFIDQTARLGDQLGTAET